MKQTKKKYNSYGIFKYEEYREIIKDFTYRNLQKYLYSKYIPIEAKSELNIIWEIHKNYEK